MSMRVDSHKPTALQHRERKVEEARVVYRTAELCIRKARWQVNNGTHDSQEERDPHEKIEATKNIIKGFLPVDGGWRTDDILAITLPATNSGKLQTDCGMTGIPGVYFVNTE